MPSPGKDATPRAGGGDPGQAHFRRGQWRCPWKAKPLGLRTRPGWRLWGLDSRSSFLPRLMADCLSIPGCPACLLEVAANCPFCHQVTPLAYPFAADTEHVSATFDLGAGPPALGLPVWGAGQKGRGLGGRVHPPSGAWLCHWR